MTASDAAHPIWKQLVKEEKVVALTFMAGNILLTRIRREAKSDPSKVEKGAQELFDLYMKNQALPSVKRDLPNLIGHL